MSLELKINVRHSNTGGLIRSIKQFTNFSFDNKYNAMASTFSFDFNFDPANKEHAEIVCVSHMHECQIFWDGRLIDTGYILANRFRNNGKPQLVTISGYSKGGVFGDCDIPKEVYPLEVNGLNLAQIIRKVIAPFNIKLQIDPNTSNISKKYIVEDKDEMDEIDDIDEVQAKLNTTKSKLDTVIDKTASDSSQNIGSYISTLATQMNICVGHAPNGDLRIKNPNTKGVPIFNFDFTSDDPANDANKIPGIETYGDWNCQPLHTHIRVVQQAEDEEGTNSADTTIRNPLIPIKKSVLFRPKTVNISSGDQFTINEMARYELGKEIREGFKLTVSIPKVALENQFIEPDNTITIRDPTIFLYNKCTWYIQSVQSGIEPNKDMVVLNCVLPYAYDFDLSKLKNVFVDPHQNLPRF